MLDLRVGLFMLGLASSRRMPSGQHANTTYEMLQRIHSRCKGLEDDQCYFIVDFDGESSKLLAVNPAYEVDIPKYYEDVTRDREANLSSPVLVIMFGPAGCGKSSTLAAFRSEVGWTAEDYVHLDPDSLRFYSRDYRMSMSGVYASQLPGFKEKYGDFFTPTTWNSPVGGFSELGLKFVDDGEPMFPALSSAVLRSIDVVRNAMLWQKGDPVTTNSFVDRALRGRYNIVYDTAGNDPDGLGDAMIRRARLNQYSVKICGCYAPWSKVAPRIGRRARNEGRFLPPTTAKKLFYDVLYPSGDMDNFILDKYAKLLHLGEELYLYNNTGSEPILHIKERITPGMVFIHDKHISAK